MRTLETIQGDIGHTAGKIQELRQTQGLSARQDIRALTVRLDALYEEKRAAQAPADAPTAAAAERASPAKRGRAERDSVSDLIAQLFRADATSN